MIVPETNYICRSKFKIDSPEEFLVLLRASKLTGRVVMNFSQGSCSSATVDSPVDIFPETMLVSTQGQCP